MIDEHEVSDRIHSAFEMEPLPGGFERLRMTLDSRSVTHRHAPLRLPSPRRWAALVAAFAVVAIAASALGYALYQHRSTVSRRAPAPTALLPVVGYWAYSADDVAMRVAAPASPLVISHDGGKTWIQTPLDQNRIGVRWIDSHHLIAIMDNIGPPFEVASSNDGGASWRVVEAKISDFSSGEMFFLNDHEGWSLCRATSNCAPGNRAPGVYHTLDGGTTWKLISDLSSFGAIELNQIVFTDALHGVLTTISRDDGAHLLTTRDGGHTWTPVTLTSPNELGGGDATCQLACVYGPLMFGSRGVLAMSPVDRGAYTFTTADGGSTWGSPRSLPFAYYGLLDFAAADPLHWWGLDISGQLFATGDAGATWSQVAVHLPPQTRLGSVEPVGGGVLWGASSNRTGDPFPLLSTDGGRTWTFVELPKT